MSMHQDPELYALMDETNAGEAFLASLSALYDPAALKHETIRRDDSDIYRSIDLDVAGSSLDEVLAVKREALRHGYAGARIPFFMRLRNTILDVVLTIKPTRNNDGRPSGLMLINDCQIMPDQFYFVESHGALSLPARAAILGLLGQERMDRIFLAMCAPDAHSRVKMGVYNMLDKLYERYATGSHGWRAALEMAATYHGNHEVARDLAFTWLDLHDGCLIDSVVHLSLDEIIARIEGAPRGSAIGISSRTEHVVAHGVDESQAAPPDLEQRTQLNCYLGPRPRYPEDHELTREQVLAALQTPSETLLQALEAAAVPDAQWVEAEKRALEILPMPKEGEPITWLFLDELEERNFLEEHAPYHVRRLPNGGVMLATHPYRYLWPLWSTALDLLGIRPKAA